MGQLNLLPAILCSFGFPYDFIANRVTGIYLGGKQKHCFGA